MKKILFAIAIILTIGLTANAQNKQDSFFSGWDDNGWTNRGDAILPVIPSINYNSITDEPAPLGSGLLVLTALSAGYAVARKRKK